MTHHILTIHASPKQLSKLRNGHSVRIKKGKGFNLVVHPMNYRLASRAFAKNKGIEIQLSPEEVEANRYMSPEQHQELQSTNPEMAGQGIFGPKFDRFLEKHGIRDLAYEIGDKFKPLAKTALTGGLTAGAAALGAVQPELIPFLAPGVAGLSALGHDYLDNPGKYQKSFVSGVKTSPVRDMAEQAVKAKLNEKLNKELGTNYDYMNRAGLENAAMQTINAKLNADSVNSRLSSKPESPASHMATYGYGFHMRGRGRKEHGTVGLNGGLVNYVPPALMSQPFGANYQFSHFLPPQYQHFNRGAGLYGGGGLYAGRS